MLRSILLILISSTSTLLSMTLSWPTEDDSFFKGAPIESLIQPTASGALNSGLFGYVRSNGKKFHEGIDIKSKKHNRKGEPTDKILAAIEGRVVYTNNFSGNSEYGRYIVILHDNLQVPIYTLYAHLSGIDPSVKVGKKVHAGEIIGVMGRSSNEPIPKQRAHLHFEMGVMLSENFENWYSIQKFGNPNRHNIWHGFNLTGFDPLDFYTKWKTGKITSVDEYFRQFPVAFSLRIYNKKIPSFIKRYSRLATKPIESKNITGWDIDFTWFALPFRWTPLYESNQEKSNGTLLTAYNTNLFSQHNCSNTVIVNNDKHGKVLKKTLSLLFDH